MLDYRNILRVASDPHKSMRTMELELRHTIPFERCWTRQKGEGYAPEGRYRGEESRKREGHQGFRGFGRSACQGVKGRLYRTFTASGMGRNVKT